MVKVPKGELTSAEIRKLIRGHNKLVNIKVPTGLDRDGLIKFLKSKKFEVDHKNKRLIDKSPARGKSVSLETAKAITKPKPKTALQKQKAEEAKAEKAEKKKKEERVIRKKAVEEEKKRSKSELKPKPAPKAKPAPKKVSFKTLDQVKNSFNKTLSNFKKQHVEKFIDSLKDMKTTKEVKDKSQELRKKGRENVLITLKTNEELFEKLDPDEEVYDELEEKYESVINLGINAGIARIKELRKDE